MKDQGINTHISILSIVLCIAGIVPITLCQVELDERFLEYRKEGMWLVEFYAPWCGHCKKLEPVYREVARELHNRGSEVRVGKVDATRYSSLASEFSVRGFPTIMFIKGDHTYNHRGDRSKESIVEFVLRAQGPTVRKLSSIGKLNQAIGDHSDSVFFIFIGEEDENNDVYRKYVETAEEHAIQAYFYAGKKHILNDRPIMRFPTLLVFKDSQYYEFEPPSGVVTASSISAWVKRERHPSFPLVAGAGVNDVVSAARWLVVLAVDSQDMEDYGSLSSRLHRMFHELALNRDKYHKEFQFVWMKEVETLNSIAMAFLASPAVMVYESDSQLYYLAPLPDGRPLSSLADFLDRVARGEEEAYGGTGFKMRIKRIFYDIISTILSIWQASRWLFLLMFGLPTAIISVVCYSLCCMDTIDDMGEEEEEEYDTEDEEERDRKAQLPMPASEENLPSYGDVADQKVDVADSKSNEDKKNE